jgi:hypothetical protein
MPFSIFFMSGGFFVCSLVVKSDQQGQTLHGPLLENESNV